MYIRTTRNEGVLKLNKELIAQKLVSLRNGEKREKVAQDLNISISALQMYETGHRIPKDEIKVKIAAYYKISVQELFFEDKPCNSCS